MPYVKNAPVQIETHFLEEHYIKGNGTILFIGEIEKIYVNEDVLSKDGFINLSKGEIASINSLDGYTCLISINA